MVYANTQTTRPVANVSGLHTSALSQTTTTAQTVNPQAQTTPTFNGIQRPRQPESTVKPVEINIPDFLKNSKR